MNTADKARLHNLLDQFAAAHQDIGDVQHEIGTTRYTCRVWHASNVRDLIVEFVDSFVTGELITTDPRAGLRTCEVGPIDDPLQCWFHGWCGTSERPKAIIEGPHGNIVLWEHDEIRFTDIPGEENSCA